MPQCNVQNINVKKTIESTMERAKRWLFAKYPSARFKDKNIQIDVRYLGEDMPSSPIEIFPTPIARQGLNFQNKPIGIVMKRDKTEIYLIRDVFYDTRDQRQTSYVLSIHTPSYNYRIIETPDGYIKDQGNHLLLLAAQKDKDFSQYISFVPKDYQTPLSSKISPWVLNNIMVQSR